MPENTLPKLATKRIGRKQTIPAKKQESPVDEVVILQVLTLAEEGLQLRNIAEQIGIPENTLYSWKYRNISNLQERLHLAYLKGDIKRAENKMRELMELEAKNSDGQINSRVLAIQQKEAEFIRSNVIEAQKYYSNRPQVNVQVNLPQPIIDLGNISAKELDK